MDVNREQFPTNLKYIYFCLECKNYYGVIKGQSGQCPFCGDGNMKKILSGNSNKRDGGMDWATDNVDRQKKIKEINKHMYCVRHGKAIVLECGCCLSAMARRKYAEKQS